MNNERFYKAGATEGSIEITDDILKNINNYTRRELNKDEVYVFPLVLCDNEVDRDNEAFTAKTLDGLMPMYVGKTIIVDHVARSENQVARIFETMLDKPTAKKTRYGEQYVQLKAFAYIPINDTTKALIESIDTGIKKEVSIGCQVKNIVCSICGKSQRQNPCEHIKGKSYNGENCFYKLDGAEDAYEVSFVAVPAQRRAGVIKSANSIKDYNDALNNIIFALEKLKIAETEKNEHEEANDLDFKIEDLINSSEKLIKQVNTRGDRNNG